jgi:hypothetical protein
MRTDAVARVCVLLAIVSLASACGTPAGGDDPTGSPVVPAASEAASDPTGAPSDNPAPSLPQVVVADDWPMYVQTSYGFSLRYPPEWLLSEVADPDDTMFEHRVTLTDPGQPGMALHIAFRNVSEDRQITPTGMGSGEVVSRGSVPLLGTDALREALVAEGKDMAILYGGGGEVPRGDLVFWIGLNYAGSPLSDPGLSLEVQALADAVIASIQTVP